MAVSSSDYPLAWTTPDRVRTFLSDMAPQNVGKQLAKLRKEAGGMSQEALADAIGVRARTVSRWETGVTGGLYDEEILARIATALTEHSPGTITPEDIIGPRAPGSASPDQLAELQDQLDRIEENQAKLQTQLNGIQTNLATLGAGLSQSLSESVDAAVRDALAS